MRVAPSSDAPAVLPIRATALRLARGGRSLIDGLDLAIDGGGGIMLILGPNGAGKSVLLRLLAGLIAPDSGEVLWADTRPDRTRAPRVGFVFQRPVLLRRSVAANIEYALAVTGVPRSERRERAMTALEVVGLSHLASSQARVLSGGEQQRVALARVLATGPDVLFLDEPTSNLDPASTAAIETVLRRAMAAGMRLVMVTQDLGQARRLAGEVLFMHKGRILERTEGSIFFRAPSSAEARAFLAGDIVM